ncbi:MAG: class I SAM-dependent methyltransferase [Steroidobacteraceae bacterium]
MLTALPLPELEADELAHCARVEALIGAEIDAAGGWMPFARFMELALFAPGLGYYSAGARKFGAHGDFITAPELTPVFGACLARSIAGVLEDTGGGDLLEVGAGSGILAASLLGELQALDRLPRRYRILEVSGELRQRQRQALESLGPLAERVEWLDAPPAADWDGVLVANEVLDALPVERFMLGDAGVDSIGVVRAGSGFAAEARPADDGLAAELDRRLAGLARLPSGYVSEIARWSGPWVESLLARLRRGLALFIDYGLPRAQYYHPSRQGGTLCAFFRHRRVDDVLARPGLQDLTAWVDFTTVAEAGLTAGFEVAGFSTQAHFLLACGLDTALERHARGLSPLAARRLGQAAATLVLPGEMGERFKVIGLGRRLGRAVQGFGFRDLAGSL